jgi:C-terminal processing protease CtpA/Prc
LEGGALYVDLRRAEMSAISERIEELAAAPGVIFDLRGYPNGNHDVLRHLTDKPLQSAHWMVPQIIYPDRENIVGYDRSGRWNMEPAEPKFVGRTIFLTDGSAISYAESFMGIVEHYRLGDIVGQPTAGTNGNVNPLTLPGGYRITWTGMRVEKHDGSQHHLVGILPTLPIELTIQGIREGRDEYMEAALELIRADDR